MRTRLTKAVAAVLFATTVAVAEPMSITVDPSQIHVTPIAASLAPIGTADGMTGMAAQFDGIAPPALRTGGTVLYDNVPTILGGTGTPGIGTWVFIDWTTENSELADFVSLKPGFAPLINTLNWSYFNSAGSSTTSIRLYSTNAPPPSIGGSFTGIGNLVANIVIPGLPGAGSGFFGVSVTGLSVPFASSNMYIGFEDINGSGDGTGNTFWLTGGFPGIGMSDDKLIGHQYESDSGYAIVGPFVAGANNYYNGNIAFAVRAPAPATIVVLLLGGFFFLQHRRG